VSIPWLLQNGVETERDLGGSGLRRYCSGSCDSLALWKFNPGLRCKTALKNKRDTINGGWNFSVWI
jgi:hypothetical protein